MTKALRLERDGAVARLLIDRPDRRNAFDQAMWEALPRLVEEAVADRRVRLLVLISAQEGLFCAGADIAEFAACASDPEWRRSNRQAIRTAQTTLARAAIPVVAAIGGDCIGGGCGLALACDIRLSSPRARYGITPAKLGLVYPLHDTKLLVDAVGPAQAKRLLFTADLLDAREAWRIGLVDLLEEDLWAALAQLTDRITAASPYSLGAMKRIVRHILDGATDDDESTFDQFDSAFTQADFAEGVAAFLAKRKPMFPDRQ